MGEESQGNHEEAMTSKKKKVEEKKQCCERDRNKDGNCDVHPAKPLKPLIPPDLGRCQADVPNGYNFMTLGGRPGRERCKTLWPVTIAHEVQPGADGRSGSMALCPDCWEAMIKQLGSFHCYFTPITGAMRKEWVKIYGDKQPTA